MSGGSTFGNVRTAHGGQVYDGAGEAAYARHLDLLQAAGAIRAWRRGTPGTLLESPTGRKRDGIEDTPDVHVWDARGARYVVDFEGCVTREFTLKATRWRTVYPTVPLGVVRADGSERRAA
jgi:hypothetical protein